MTNPQRPTGAPDAGWIAFGGRWAVDLPVDVSFSYGAYERRWSYELSFDLDPEAGKPICTSLTASQIEGCAPVETDSLRVPVSHWLQIGDPLIHRLGVDDEGNSAVTPWDRPHTDDFSRAPDDDLLDRFCDVWTYYHLRGKAPGKHIQMLYNVTPPTTTRWITTARRKGILSDEHIRLA